MPTSADAVVPFEDTLGGLDDSLGEIVVLRAPRARGAFVRQRADDLAVGDDVLSTGVVLGALQLAAAAAAGVAEVDVSRAPRVVVVSTGSELVEPGQTLVRGQIPDSNGILLSTLCRDAGAVVVRQVAVSDESAALEAVVAEAALLYADAIVFSGGVSAGAFEVVKNTLGAIMEFSRIAMQPGKPQGFGVTATGALLFGLPGNPVSAAVSFEVFVRPALLAMQGRTQTHRPLVRLPAAAAWRTPPGRRQYLPAAIDRSDPGRWTVRPATAGVSASHLSGGLARAEAYAIVPTEVEAIDVGDPVDVMLVT